jgi:hypothetical protein
MTSRTEYSTQTPKKFTLFTGQYLRKHSTLDIGVLGYIGIVWPKEHSPEVRSFPPGTPCIFPYSINWIKHQSISDPIKRLFRINTSVRSVNERHLWSTLLWQTNYHLVPKINLQKIRHSKNEEKQTKISCYNQLWKCDFSAYTVTAHKT